jgi:hypothetical protein
MRIPPLFDEDGMSVYLTAQYPEMEVGKIIHFALGLFWKASVHSWKKDSTEPRIELGPYSEAIRRWLLNECGFPMSLYLIVIVAGCVLVQPEMEKRRSPLV